ncbi:MAG: hypothetical protein Q8N44_16680 [Rubrivivax sp.]|nr:hypothetical protein [Rubrivivax sp.]
MKGISSELLLLLLFGAFMVFNIVMQRAARKRQAQEAPPELLAPDEFDAQPPADELLAQLAASAGPARAPRAAPVVPVAPVTRARRRFSRQALFGSRRAAQDAFVVATILGRCRADQPHEPL